MKVRTIRTHSNTYGDSYEKNGSAGPVYEVADPVAAQALIDAGYVEAHNESKDGAGGGEGAGTSSARTAKSDGA